MVRSGARIGVALWSWRITKSHAVPSMLLRARLSFQWDWRDAAGAACMCTSGRNPLVSAMALTMAGMRLKNV
ncbi:hypothetical protein [Akkermansia muciniphila]|uniref:hypothetical protein n=1 Tax=Akkermansia muciniphila TaxID=239935 RepID=UPI0016518130|nr:hypothetical protein [Akkermansia muciniphila]